MPTAEERRDRIKAQLRDEVAAKTERFMRPTASSYEKRTPAASGTATPARSGTPLSARERRSQTFAGNDALECLRGVATPVETPRRARSPVTRSPLRSGSPDVRTPQGHRSGSVGTGGTRLVQTDHIPGLVFPAKDPPQPGQLWMSQGRGAPAKPATSFKRHFPERPPSAQSEQRRASPARHVVPQPKTSLMGGTADGPPRTETPRRGRASPQRSSTPSRAPFYEPEREPEPTNRPGLLGYGVTGKKHIALRGQGNVVAHSNTGWSGVSDHPRRGKKANELVHKSLNVCDLGAHTPAETNEPTFKPYRTPRNGPPEFVPPPCPPRRTPLRESPHTRSSDIFGAHGSPLPESPRSRGRMSGTFSPARAGSPLRLG